MTPEARAARLHRRRLHRRDRSRQHAGARRHAHGADHRRAGRGRSPIDVDARRRRAQVAHRSPPTTRSRSRSAALAGCTRRAAASSTSSTARPSTRPTEGNIGPVADALMDALGRPISPSPARRFRRTAARSFSGYLFVGDVLLNESGMREPSAHADDRRRTSCACCSAQTKRKVGLIDYDVIAQGADAIRDAHRGAASAKACVSPSSTRSPTPTCYALGRSAARTCR